MPSVAIGRCLVTLYCNSVKELKAHHALFLPVVRHRNKYSGTTLIVSQRNVLAARCRPCKRLETMCIFHKGNSPTAIKEAFSEVAGKSVCPKIWIDYHLS